MSRGAADTNVGATWQPTFCDPVALTASSGSQKAINRLPSRDREGAVFCHSQSIANAFEILNFLGRKAE